MADVSITAADVKPGEVGMETETVEGGATINEGMALYQDASTGKYLPADCTDEDKLNVTRIALSAGGDGDPIVVARPQNLIALGAVLLLAETYILSTGGAICPIADLAANDHLVIIGYGSSGTVLDFRPYNTGYQKA